MEKIQLSKSILDQDSDQNLDQDSRTDSAQEWFASEPEGRAKDFKRWLKRVGKKYKKAYLKLATRLYIKLKQQIQI